MRAPQYLRPAHCSDGVLVVHSEQCLRILDVVECQITVGPSHSQDFVHQHAWDVANLCCRAAIQEP